MLFNSVEFAFFLPIVFILYWLIPSKNLRLQNILLLIASYFFYSCWDFRFLFLLIFSTFLDYYSGLKIYAAENRSQKKFWMQTSIAINLGFLGIFKYYNFFTDSFMVFMEGFGLKTNAHYIELVLPVGISFYTFHGISYVLDIYYDRFQPTRNYTNYSLFVSFFPLLVAGPIERASHLLPQIERSRVFDYLKAKQGLKQILWGLFKKVVVADNCAEYVNMVFDDYHLHSGSTLLLASIVFAFQIYGDFSGYSDIALGVAKLFGFDLLKNFAYPYFSRDIAEFWRRWHISLSSWFRDYLYVPLGGSRGGTFMKIRNTFIIFIVSGFWHGANWTFVFWGFLNALYFLPYLLTNKNRSHLDVVAKGRLMPSPKEFLQITSTFLLTCLAWIFFRSTTILEAWIIIKKIITNSFFVMPDLPRKYIYIPLFIMVLVLVEWRNREEDFALKTWGENWPLALRWALYYCLIIFIFLFTGTQQKFIYFQF